MEPIQILLWWYGVCWDFMKNNEWLALWVEGLALVAIFIWDRIDRSHEKSENLAQLAVAKKQIHADRVAGIFSTMRDFATPEHLQKLRDSKRCVVHAES